MLNQIGAGRRRVGHGVGAVADHEAVILLIMLFNETGDGKPVLRLHVGAVDIEGLDAGDLTELPGGGNVVNQLLAG